MKTELVRQEDLHGVHWRLALIDDPDAMRLQVTVECMYSAVVTDWVHVQHVTYDPESIGVEWRKSGVVMVDSKRARRELVAAMAKHSAVPRPADLAEGLASLSTLPGVGPVVTEAKNDAHRQANLLEYLVEVEATAADATPGVWRSDTEDAAEQLRVTAYRALSAVITGAMTDPVAESMSPADLQHVLATQPLATGAMVRKLREAFFLLQDMAKAVLAMRGELDAFSRGMPAQAPPGHEANVAMLDSWLTALRKRCAQFPAIQVPDVRHPGPLASQAPRQSVLSREDLVKLARFEALREGFTGTHDYLPRDRRQAEEFVPHEWVLWAMAAAVATARGV